MKITFFSDCKTLDDLKKAYRKLAKIHHPDCGGSNDDMRVINNEYDYLKTRLTSSHEEEWRQKQEFENMDIFREMINKVIHLPITIEICGDWIWLSGNTKEYKEYLGKNGAGFKWAPKKLMWYWAPYKLKGRPKSEKSMEEIRRKYGSQSVKNQEPHYLNN